MGSERTHVDKYLCTVCGHRHSNGWYCKHSIDAKDAEIERLKAQLAASEEKRKVLGAECQAWRKAWQDVPCSKPECSICLSTKATDAVSALEGT